MIKAVIFDLGGVIISDELTKFEEENAWRLQDSKQEKYFEVLDKEARGYISDVEFEGIIDDSFGPGSWDEVYQRVRRAAENPDQDILKLITELKVRYKIGLLSNNINPWSSLVKRQVYFKLFDAAVFSDDVGVRKPEGKIFQIILEKLGVKAKEAVFIDNQENNIDGARKLGIKAIKYDNIEQLRRDLNNELRIKS